MTQGRIVNKAQAIRMLLCSATMPSGEDADEQISVSLTLDIEFETLIHNI